MQYVLDRSIPVKNPNGGMWPIKSGVAVDEGDPVALDSNGQVVLADANGIPAHGFAVFSDKFGDAKATRTGVAALTVKCAIYKRAQVINAKGGTSMTIGADQFLSETAATVTTTIPTTTNAVPQCLGTAITATCLDGFAHPPVLKAQGSGSTIITLR